MTETATVAPQSRLEQLTQKYGYNPQAVQQRVHNSFNAAASRKQDLQALTRISKSPGTETETGAIHQEMAAIQLDLTALAEKYGMLNVEFGDLMRGDRLYGRIEAAKILFYDAFGGKDK